MLKIVNPEFLILLLFIPFILWFYYKNRKKVFIKYPLSFLFQKNTKIFEFRIILNFLIFLMLILALCNFQILKKFSSTYKKGINIILTLDTSGSMNAVDFKKNGKEITRLEALKDVVSKFIDKRPNDKIGLVVFGKEAFTQCPLTIDHKILKDYIENLNVGMAGDSTSIGNAILLSIKRLKNAKVKTKIIILVTDGRNNSGIIDPITASILAKDEKIKIYTIGIGTKGSLVPIYVKTPFGIRKMLINADLDDTTLKEIAKITGGKYFNAVNFTSLKDIYNEIDKLEKEKFKVKYYFERQLIYPYFLILAIFLLLIKIFIFKQKFEVVP